MDDADPPRWRLLRTVTIRGRGSRAGAHRGAHAAHRPVVGRAGGHLHPAGGLAAVCAHPHGVAALLLRRGVPLPLAVLVALPLGVLRPRLSRLRDLVRRVPAVRPARPAGPAVPARVPADLLLLPQGLLPIVLALAAGLRRRRAAREVHRRDPLPPDPPERAPLLLLRRDCRVAHQQLRRHPGVPRQGRRVRYRARHADHAGERRLPLGLHRFLSLLPPPHRRPAAALLQAPDPLLAVDPGVEAQHPPHAARLDDARDPHGHGRLHRAGVSRRHYRSEAGELTWLLLTRPRRTRSSATSTTSSSSGPVAPGCARPSPPARPVCAWP